MGGTARREQHDGDASRGDAHVDRRTHGGLTVIPTGIPDETASFLHTVHGDGRWARVRTAQVADEIRATGTYAHTPHELAGGARMAWRNALDCLGRAHWRILQVVDARWVTDTDGMYEVLTDHLHAATNGGQIQLLMTVLPAAAPGEPGFRIWNSQLIRYAGHELPDGTVLGDPDTVASTRLAARLGWSGRGTAFDVLPLMLQAPGGPVVAYEIPPQLVTEVAVTHPTIPGFDALGLRWYAHPAISNQRLRIGGLDYTAAPFSGWYTVPEIAVRALGDGTRYDQLARVADLLGLDTSSDRTLWKERAQLELMTAVLHSYDRAGVTIVDHHFAAKTLARHIEREHAAGRSVNARWRRLIPASAPSTSAIFDMDFPEVVELPNFFPQPVCPPVADGVAGPRPS